MMIEVIDPLERIIKGYNIKQFVSPEIRFVIANQ